MLKARASMAQSMERRATVLGGPVKISMSSIFAADSQDRTVSRQGYFSKRSVFDIFYGSTSCDTILSSVV